MIDFQDFQKKISKIDNTFTIIEKRYTLFLSLTSSLKEK